MDKTLLPQTETLELQAKDIAYRSAIPSHATSFELDPMTCDARLLPYLAQCWQVLYWDESWSEAEKGRFVRDAREVHRHIGTPYALTKMFEALDIGATVVEWYEYGGEPYHFNIDFALRNKEITYEMTEKLRKYVDVYKNVRTVLNELTLSYMQSQRQGFASGGVGEVFINSQMLEGYEETLKGMQKISIGAVGETSSYASCLTN